MSLSTEAKERLLVAVGKDVTRDEVVKAIETPEGVASGLYVTPGVGLTVDVSAGLARAGGVLVEDAGQTNLGLTAADATNPRKDIIQISNAGVVAKKDGVAAAAPAIPKVDANNVLLAVVTVAANATTLAQGDIDNRVRSLA